MASIFSSQKLANAVLQYISADDQVNERMQNLSTELSSSNTPAELDQAIQLTSHDLDIARSNLFMSKMKARRTEAVGSSELAAIDSQITNTADLTIKKDLKEARCDLQIRVDLIVGKHEAMIKLLQMQITRFVEQLHALRTKREMITAENSYRGTFSGIRARLWRVKV